MQFDGMTVGQLRLALGEFDDSDIILLSRDPEGNGFSVLHEAGEGRVAKGDDEPLYRKLTKKLKRDGYSSEDVATQGTDAVTLYPRY